MISMTALRPTLKAVIPHLPKAAGVVVTRTLPYLPLALDIAKVLFQHREKISDVVVRLASHTSKGVKKGTEVLVKTVPCLPKKVGRKLPRYLGYLPLALTIAKESYRKNYKKVRRLTKQFPIEVKQKIDRRLKIHQCPYCLNLFSVGSNKSRKIG